MLKILSAPSTVLSSPSLPVGKVDSKVKKLVEDMEVALDAQYDPEGVGLAAPQVGVGIQLFIMKPRNVSHGEVFINPKILQTEDKKVKKKPKKSSGKEKEEALEGCLSIPRIWAPVHRHHKVLLEYQTLAGDKLTKWFSGLKSIIVQHEVDHLSGVLFTQRAAEQNAKMYEERGGKLKRLAV